MKLYIYKVVREDWNGNRGRRTKKLIRFENDLTVGKESIGYCGNGTNIFIACG